MTVGARAGFHRQFVRALLLSPFVGQTLRSLISTERRADLLVLRDLIEAGTVTPVISRTLPLGEAARALGEADEGHGRGNTVLAPLGASDRSHPAPGGPTTRMS